MAEMKLNAKGPVGAVLAVLVIGGYICYRLFMPVWISYEDKKAIKEKIEDLRSSNVSQVVNKTVERYNTTGKYSDKTKEIEELTGEIKITDIDPKRTFLGSITVKVTYTVGGKTPKGDGGTLFFRLHRRKKRRNSSFIETDVYPITEELY